MTLTRCNGQWFVTGLWKGQEINLPLSDPEATEVFKQMSIPASWLNRALK